MANLQNLLKSEIDSINVDWKHIETQLGFKIHDDLKKFYSRIICDMVDGNVNFIESKFIEKTGNKRNDTWISSNGCEGNVDYELYPLKTVEKAYQEIDNAFEAWTGGNDFGHRALIGQFYFNIGEILILFNNDTGKIEWIDCGYGYFDIYEENPNGILANSIEELYSKLQ